MANNRMWLVHSSGEKILLCKYYPPTNWYMYHSEAELNEWFEKFTPEDTMFGDSSFQIKYESADDEEKELKG